MCPWTDLAGTGRRCGSFQARDPLLDLELLRQHGARLPERRRPARPARFPLYADLRGLPPVLIQVGSGDLLHDDGVRFAEKAKAAKVDVTLEEWDGMVHVWHLFAQQLVEGRSACARAGAFLESHLAQPEPRPRAE
jgi:acetyl esterase/lipase